MERSGMSVAFWTESWRVKLTPSPLFSLEKVKRKNGQKPHNTIISWYVWPNSISHFSHISHRPM